MWCDLPDSRVKAPSYSDVQGANMLYVTCTYKLHLDAPEDSLSSTKGRTHFRTRKRICLCINVNLGSYPQKSTPKGSYAE